MKKRLLITSIVMMLVVAVALSTATYAWFTSNTTVTADAVVMTAHVADVSSISIGWESGNAGTTLAAVAGSQLFPICPIALSGTNAGAYDATNNATGLRFNRAHLDAETKFEAPLNTNLDPYTWTSSNSKDVFYINNDSPSQTVSVSVSANIKDIISTTDGNTTTYEKLENDTPLNPGKKYYTWAETSTGSGVYEATEITASSYSNGDKKVGDSGFETVYDKKPVAKQIRIAIYASDAQNTKSEVLAKTAFTYKGLIGFGGDGSTADTAMGTIVAEAAPSSVANKIASSGSVNVISSLGGNKAVYVIVKVWIDGQSFTENEGMAKASVDLTFTATNVNA